MAKATQQQKEMHSLKHDNGLDMDIIVPVKKLLVDSMLENVNEFHQMDKTNRNHDIRSILLHICMKGNISCSLEQLPLS